MEKQENNTARRRRLKGVVVSTKMTGTVSVKVSRVKVHPIYGKRYRQDKKYLADPGVFADLVEGDQVVIEETSPQSKLKRWRVVKKTS